MIQRPGVVLGLEVGNWVSKTDENEAWNCVGRGGGSRLRELGFLKVCLVFQDGVVGLEHRGCDLNIET